MKRHLLPLCALLALWGVLMPASPGVARPNCVPFEATATVTLTVLDQHGITLLVSLNGTGTGTIGDFTLSSRGLFIFHRSETDFVSHTTITTPDGTIASREMGDSLPTGARGSFRLNGGTGIYKGATGSGSFEVVVNADGTQTGHYMGDLCLPPDHHKRSR